jgi:hypothetical protein
MNMQICTRLIWQIPVLIFLVAMLTPSVSWDSSTIGAWPVWLLSMPLFAFVRAVIRKRNTLPQASPINSAQVLVFNRKKPVGRKVSLRNRQAA